MIIIIGSMFVEIYANASLRKEPGFDNRLIALGRTTTLKSVTGRGTYALEVFHIPYKT